MLVHEFGGGIIESSIPVPGHTLKSCWKLKNITIVLEIRTRYPLPNMDSLPP